MQLIFLKRTALFVTFVLIWALFAAAVAHSETRNVVNFSGYSPGTIVVKTSERQLYYVVDHGRAVVFPVGVGRKGKAWTGKARVEGKYVEPAWAPPDEILRDHPDMPRLIKGGAEDNPMGAAALTLRGGEYAIHGTNNPDSIGGFVSYGCIRMYNRDIRELYRMVDVGTPVVVTR
jgi:lipoprotein-anchoring transpeptidase ErfK/SrfK